MAALLVLLAVALLALLVTGTYGFTSMYGFVARDLQPVDGALVLLLAAVAVLLLLGARDQVGAHHPSTAVVAATGLALFAGGAAAGSALGGAAHDRSTATVRSACSTDDRELLAAVEFPDYRTPPRGDPSGGCVLHLHPRQDAGTAVADLTAGLERDGWRSTEERGDALVLERDGAVLSVVTVSDDKTTEILLTVH